MKTAKDVSQGELFEGIRQVAIFLTQSFLVGVGGVALNIEDFLRFLGW